MISLQDFLARLDGVEHKGGEQYMARCPCHDDHRASLAVSMGEQKIVCHCLAGCAYEDIIEALGLDWKDVMKPEYLKDAAPRGQKKPRKLPTPKPEPPPPKEKKPVDTKLVRLGGEYTHKVTDKETGKSSLAHEKITRCYEYTDQNGVPLLRVFRTEAKSFPVIHADGGKWYWGDGGQTALLYRLPKVLKAIEAGERVYIVEGEKDVETLESLGFTATTNKGGAGKWPDELSKLLTSAVVAIVPDVDEPGVKHGRLVAKSLEGYAKEVTIINLRRLSCKLPDKGDISDVVEIMGAAAAKEALLTQLQRSPVLSRRVSDEDYADYFANIRGAAVENGAILGWSKDSYRPLCNFVALPVEQVLLDDGQGELRYKLTIMGWSAKGYRLKPLSVDLEAFDAMAWPLKGWGLDANIDDGNGTKQKLRRIIQEAGSRAAISKTMYCHTGWREIDGRMCYLHGGGVIGAEDAAVRLDYGFDRYNLSGLQEDSGMMSDPPQARRVLCQAASIRVMHIAGLRIGVPLIGFMYLTPLRHFLALHGHRPSFIPFVRGVSGSGKSTIAALALNHFGYDFGFESSMPANFENTAGAIGLKLFALKDMPLLVDDYHPESDAKRAAAMTAVAEQMCRMIGDGVTRSRLKSDSTAMADKPVRGLCFATGEELPRVPSSTIARMYVIDVEPKDVPLPIYKKRADKAYLHRMEEMAELHKLARQGALSEAMRGYIEWLAARADALADELDVLLEEMMAEALARSEGMHARSPTAMAYLMLGIRMMLEYMSEPGGMYSRDDIPVLMEDYWKAITANSKEQSAEMASEKPTEQFLTTVRELVQSGKCVVQDMASVAAAAPLGLIGYRDESYYYLNPGQTFGAVQKSLADQGVRFPLGKNMLLRMLATEGKLVKDPTGKNVRQINKGGLHAWMMCIPRYVLEDTKPTVRAEQLTLIPAQEDKDNPFIGGEEP